VRSSDAIDAMRWGDGEHLLHLGALLTELVQHHSQSGEQFLRRPEARAAARANVFDPAREDSALRPRFAAELHHEGFPSG